MRWLSLLIASFAIAAASGAAFALPQPEAEAAYARGDYETAFKLWLPLAMEGSAQAQLNVGRMYERGEWVAQDKQAAMEWYSKAAEQSARDAAMAGAPMGGVASADTAGMIAPVGAGPIVTNAVRVPPTRIVTPVQPATYPPPTTYPSPASPVIVPAARPIFVPVYHHHFHHH
jgi:hypothetical protein